MAENKLAVVKVLNFNDDFLVERYTSALKSIGSIGSSETHLTFAVSKSGYAPIGIVGLSSENSSDGSQESNINTRRFYLTRNSNNTGTLDFYGGSFGSGSKVHFYVDILWRKVS